MPERLTVFLWSLPEELSFRDYLRGLADDLRVCPLRPAAWYAACELFSASEMCDCRRLVTPAEREEFDRRAAESASRVRMILQSHRREPWLQGLEFYHKVTPLLYYFYCWDLILRRLRREGDRSFRVYGPFSRGSIPGADLLEVDALELMVIRPQAERRLEGAYRLRRWLASRIGRAAAAALATGESLRVRLGLGRQAAGSEPRLLLAGLQETDAVFQAPLAAALRQWAGDRFRWWRLEPEQARICLHETTGEGRSSRGAEMRYAAGRIAQRNSALGRCMREYAVQRIAGACRRVREDGLLQRYAEEIARILVDSHPDPVAEYRRVSRFLHEERPSLVVGYSNLGLMAHVRSWCRYHRVPFIRLPHGVEPAPRHRALHDADIVGVTGAYDRRRLEQYQVRVRCSIAGGVHLATQGKRLRREFSLDGTRSGGGELCYLSSSSLYSAYPDTISEVEGDLVQLASAARTCGLRLRIRPHPRSRDRELYAEIVRNRLKDVLLSEPAERSLGEDFRSVTAALARLWSGACVLALYCRIPLLGWLPRSGEPESAARVARLPLVARSGVELERLLKRLVQDPEFRDAVLERQDRLLEDEIEDPFGEEYELAVRMIESVTERKSLQLKGDLA